MFVNIDAFIIVMQVSAGAGGGANGKGSSSIMITAAHRRASEDSFCTSCVTP
jgi:hypothetical protein